MRPSAVQIPASDNSGHTRRTERNRLEVPVLRLPESEASEDAQPERSVPEQALEPVTVPPLERVPELALLQEQEQRRAPRPELVQVSEPELVQPLVQELKQVPVSEQLQELELQQVPASVPLLVQVLLPVQVLKPESQSALRWLPALPAEQLQEQSRVPKPSGSAAGSCAQPEELPAGSKQAQVESPPAF